MLDLFKDAHIIYVATEDSHLELVTLHQREKLFCKENRSCRDLSYQLHTG